MREILFRGKRKDNGEWVYGSLDINVKEYPHISYAVVAHGMAFATDFDVIPETVGQCTGLTDKSGLTKVFDGDIIRYVEIDVDGSESTHIGVFYYDAEKAAWAIRRGEYRVLFANLWLEYIEIVGNVFDNPDLLGG